MSQNKTVVPGLENSGYSGQQSQHADFYARTPMSNGNMNGTVVPGMSSNNSETISPSEMEQQQQNHNLGKPVAGFLYSVSKQGIGEYWPIHLGRNTIGSSYECDICLREGTVSSEHAELVIRKMKNPEKTIASLSDVRSTNGTMINGESLGFSAVECFNGDVITIGENYELVLLLIDVKALGLKISENFIPMQETYYATSSGNDSHPETTILREPLYPPHFVDPTSLSIKMDPNDGTVGLDGSTSNIKSGGTVGM